MMPGNPIVGGTVLRIPAVQSPNYSHGITGWILPADGDPEFNSGTFRGTVTATTFQGINFVIDSSGAFFYSSVPAQGNLIVSIAGASGIDPYGNAYPEGMNVTTGIISGSIIESNPVNPGTKIDNKGNVILFNSHGAQVMRLDVTARALFGYLDTGSASQGSLAVALASAAGTDSVTGTAFVQGVNVFPQATPTQPTTGSTLFANINGTPSGETSSGLVGQLPLTGTDVSSISNASTSINRLTKTWLVPAGDPNVGSTYELECWGIGTQGNPTENLNVRLFYGPNTITWIAPGSIFGTTQIFSWCAKMRVQISSLGVSGACIGGIEFTWSANATGSTSNTVTGVQTAVQSLNTNNQFGVEFQAGWAAITGTAPTISCFGSTFMRTSA